MKRLALLGFCFGFLASCAGSYRRGVEERSASGVIAPVGLSRAVVTGSQARVLSTTVAATVSLPVRLTGSARVALVGDIILARRVAQTIRQRGGAWPIQEVAPLLHSADLAVANLESPAGDNPIAYVEKSVLFRANPADLDLLSQAGIGLVSLANNHILDYGPGVAGRTEAELRSRGIAYAGLIRHDGQSPRVDLNVRGVKIAFLSYCSVCHKKFRLKGSTPGSAPGVLHQMIPHIRQAKKDSDFVLVAMHWGQEYYGANALQKKMALKMVEAGADVIMGSHTHVLQKVERLGDSLVIYGLGNFVFDLKSEIAQDSAVLMLSLEKGKPIEYKIYPVSLKSGRPRLLSPEEADYQRIEWMMQKGYQYGGRRDYPDKMRNFRREKMDLQEALQP